MQKQFREFGEIRKVVLRNVKDNNEKGPSAVVTFVERDSAGFAVTVCSEQGQRVWEVRLRRAYIIVGFVIYVTIADLSSSYSMSRRGRQSTSLGLSMTISIS